MEQSNSVERGNKEESLIKPLDNEVSDTMAVKKTFRVIVIVTYIILLGLGTLTGYLMATRGAGSVTSATNVSTGTKIDDSSGKKAGVEDAKSFRDSAEGVIEAGGIDGEGTHKLVRDGGPSQTAYLISSVVDLDSYVGKKVRVWGETMGAQKVSWLMDVGKIEVIQ